MQRVHARFKGWLGLTLEGLLCFPLRPFFFIRPAACCGGEGGEGGNDGSRDKHLGYALNKLSKGFSLAVLLTSQTPPAPLPPLVAWLGGDSLGGRVLFFSPRLGRLLSLF